MSFLFRYLRFHDIIGGIHVPVDDGVDKLNRKYTLLVFLFLALPIFTKQYIGDPIECFAPVYFAEHQARYINSYCWTQSTYYMVPVGDPEDDGDQQEPSDRIMPDEVDYFIGFETVTHIGNERLRRVRVSYYQWAPLILLVQGLCFYIPFLIWNSCANNAGVKLRRLLKKASDIASLPPGCQQREALLAEFVDQFHTLVTGEAGWCLDLGCQTAGSPPSSSSSSQASGASSAGPNARGAPGAGAGRTNNAQANDHEPHHDHQDTGNNSNNNGRNNARRNNNNSNNNGDPARQGCCLISIPIIGHLLDCCLKPCTSFGSVGPSKYLCLLYLAVKTAYVLNVALQFFLLGQFLGRGYLKHGLELMNRLIVNGDWWASPRFPLSTLCQVRADMSGGLRSYTCQCVLPINVFNEKIFSVVWFYMAFLMPLNVLSLLFWIYRTFENNRLSYIRLCLWRTRLVELNQIHRTVRRLSQSYLGWDGVFLLRLIEHNHGSIMATLIMSRLWEFYANQMKLQEDQNQLALANNAHHALSNTTTAISNQHQLLVAAAAAAAAAAASGGGGNQNSHAGGHSHGPNHANHSHSHSHSHSHLDNNQIHPPTLTSAAAVLGAQHHPPLMPAQAHQHQHQHFSSGANHASSGAAGGSHSHQSYLGALQVAPLMPGAGAHGPHGQHSGQISQAGHNHPLHAANTHALHAAHLAGPFAGPTNASILAQLQHQQQHQHAHQHAHPSQQQQQQQANNQTSSQQQQQQPQNAGPGNVAAAVAALTAAAAANSTTTPNSTNTSTSITANSSATTSNSTSNNNNLNQNPNSASNSVANQQQAAGVPAPAATHPALHLHSLMQSAPNTSGGLLVAPQGGPSALAAAAAGAATVASSASSSQQQQQQAAAGPLSNASTAGPTNSNAATTSFINAPTVAAPLVGQGPPLPPPPPAHVVAAVAGAAAPGMARANQPVIAGSPRGQPTAITGAPLANQGPAAAAAAAAAANPVLFNLKSSNIQPVPNGARYSPHTMKRA